PFQRRGHQAAPETLHEAGHLGEEVLADIDEARASPPRGVQGGEADDRRIGERHHHVGTRGAAAGHPGREEVADVVGDATREARLVEGSAAGAQDLDAVPRLATHEPEAAAAVPRPLAAHHRHFHPVPGHQVLAELGEELAGGAVVGPVRAVEDADPHAPFSTPVDPRTRASMRVRRKQSRAWSGVSTMGSFSLNEVLSTTGTPLSFSKALMSCQYSGLALRLTVCSLPVPSTWVTAGMTSRFSGRTG